MKKIFKLAILTVLLLTAAKTPVHAEPYEEVEKYAPYIKTDENLILNKPLVGETFLIGRTVTVNKKVDGDVVIIAQKATIEAPIKGDLRVFALQTEIKSNIEGTFSFVSENVYIPATGEIEKDAYGFAQRFNLEGKVGNNLNLVFSPNSNIRIAGKILNDFLYTEARPDITKTAVISGNIKKIDPPINTLSSQDKLNLILIRLMHSLLFAMIIIFARRFKKEAVQKGIESYQKGFLKLILRGFTYSLVLLVSSVLLALTQVGIVLAVFILCILAFTIYFSPFVPSIIIGKFIFKSKEIRTIHILVGVLIFDTIAMSPALGIIIYTISSFALLGCIIQAFLPTNKK